MKQAATKSTPMPRSRRRRARPAPQAHGSACFVRTREVGWGEVYLARDEELHREVALKEIQPDHADDPHSRARFVLEAEITGRLEHPGVVPVYSFGAYADGRPFYAMRLIKGVSFTEAIERFHAEATGGRFRSREFRGLLNRLIDVCNALEYAHSRGVLHRDLKPDNVMLGKYGETLVVDWGLAKILNRPDAHTRSDEPTLQPSSGGDSGATQMGVVLGTPQYMSPEQAEGRVGELGPASDVYSLGAMLYTLLTGEPPFGKADVGIVLRRVAAGEFPPPRCVRREAPREVALSGSADDSCGAWQPTARDPTPEEAFALAETVESLLTGFDEQEQEIVGLRLQAYSEREISTQVGRSERTVRRVLERLRRRVERLYEQPV